MGPVYGTHPLGVGGRGGVAGPGAHIQMYPNRGDTLRHTTDYRAWKIAGELGDGW